MSELTVINNALSKVESRFIELTDKTTWEREKSYAIQLFRKNPTLQKANITSTLEAIVNVANIGLSLNPALKLAYLVPRFSHQGVEVCLEASYQGLVKLITDTGSAKQVYAYVVYEGDEFQETLGTTIEIKHVPKRESNNVKLVYAVAKLHDGTMQVETMTLEDINAIKANSESFKAFNSGKIRSCVWNDHFQEMARKTVIRRLCKYLPKTDMWDKLATAIQLDETDYTINDNQINFIESLLKHSNFDHDKREQIEREMSSYTSTEANICIEMLRENQLEPITSGQNYGQTEIKAKIKNEIN